MPRDKQCGFTLLEILITLFIFSIGFLALLRLQTLMLQQSQENYFHSIANTQLQNAWEHWHIDAKNDRAIALENWQADNARLLPDGGAHIEMQTRNVDIMLFWINHFGSDKKSQISASAWYVL